MASLLCLYDGAGATTISTTAVRSGRYASIGHITPDHVIPKAACWPCNRPILDDDAFNFRRHAVTLKDALSTDNVHDKDGLYRLIAATAW